MATGSDITEALASIALFADLSPAQLEATAHTFEEQWFTEGQRIVRQGFHGGGFSVILEGEALVRVDGEDRARLGRGDFFGEISVLLDTPPSADVVAVGSLHCLVLAGPQLTEFLLAHPSVMLRMLQAEARRLRSAIEWRP